MKHIFNPAAVKLFVLLIGAGMVLTFVHDYAYRRADALGAGDYEFGGVISHAGTDMLIVTAILAVVAMLWINRRGRFDIER